MSELVTSTCPEQLSLSDTLEITDGEILEFAEFGTDIRELLDR